MQRMFKKLAWISIHIVGHAEKNFVPIRQSNHKALTGPMLTSSKSRLLSTHRVRRASDGNRLEPPQRLVPAQASPDGTAVASPGRAVMESPGVGGGILGDGESIVTVVPAALWYDGWRQ